METSDRLDFIIVGGGSLGASTVVAVKRKWPNARIAWYAGTHEHAASNDFIKIIRDAYPEDVISEFAKRALQKWMSTEPYRTYFHQTAWIQAISKDTEKILSKGQNDRAVTTAEMMDLVGSTIEPVLGVEEELYLNPNVGYADSARAIQAVSDEVVKSGVARYETNVTRLVINEGKCLGVEVGGSFVRAENTIVSVGAWTPSLLEKSQLEVPPDFFLTAAVGVAVLALSEAEFEALKSMPILVAENGTYSLTKSYRH